MIVYVVINPNLKGKDAIRGIFDKDYNAEEFRHWRERKDKVGLVISEWLVSEYPN